VQVVKGQLFDVGLDRVALTMEQIEEYDPPPFGAKMTSSRYQRYVDTTGTDDAWELDALEPAVLRELVYSNVDQHFDSSIRNEHAARARELRVELRDRMVEPGWLDEALGADR
jgi:hypothetical protein